MGDDSGKGLPKDYLITGVEVLESKLLGEGAYGVVKLGRYFGLLCAVKKLKPSMFPAGIKKLDQQTELILQSFYNECDKLSQIRHPNVVQLLGVFADKHTKLPVIVMEVMHESLSRLLYRTKALPFYVEINICHDVSQALAYLHHAFKPPIVHRDLSSNNILLSSEQRAKITDLGVAKVAKGSFLRWDDTPAPGTLVYMPPEVRKIPADLTSAMDVFALGVNMVQIGTHKFPRPGPEFSTGRLGFSKMVAEKDRRKDHLDLMGRSHALRSLAIDCLKDSPRDRPNALQLCERLEKVKELKEYKDSLQLANVKDGEVEGIRSRVSELEREMTSLREQLALKDSEAKRLDCKLVEERSYTAQILEDSTRAKLKYELMIDGMKQDGPEQKKKRKFSLKLRRNRSVKEKSDHTQSDSAQSPTDKENVESPMSCSTRPDESVSSLPPTASLTTISSDTPSATAAPDTSATAPNGKSPRGHRHKREHREKTRRRTKHSSNPVEEVDTGRQIDKANRLMWYTHRCLPEGVQGATLRAHGLGGKLYVCCGEMEDGLPNKGLFYCHVKDFTRWKRATPDVPQYQSGSAIIQNEVVLVGGLSAVSGKCTGAVQSYDSRAQVWVERFPPMPTPRSAACVFMYAEYVVVAGGKDDTGSPLNIVEVLHIPSQTWETSARLPVKVAGHSMVVCGDLVYLLGGTSDGRFQQAVYMASVRKVLSSCSRFPFIVNLTESTPLSHTPVWSRVQDCPFIKMTVVSKGNQLLAVGGEEVTQSANAVAAEWIWIYDSDTNTWTPVQGMPSARKLCCVAVLPDDNLIVIGGEPDYNRIDIAQIV